VPLERICHFILPGNNSCVEVPLFPCAAGLWVPTGTVPICRAARGRGANPTLCAGSDGTDTKGQFWRELTLSWPVLSFLSGPPNKTKLELVPCSTKL